MGERSLAACDRNAYQETSQWKVILKQLSEEGVLPRERLLDASLDALARDFAPFRSTWFSVFHDYLEPSLEERAHRLDRYLRLLACANPSSVSFGLNVVKMLHKEGRVPLENLLPHLARVVLSKHKTTVKTALGFIETGIKSEPKNRAVLIRQYMEALTSEETEVQERIIKFLAKYRGELTAETEAHLAELLSGLNASVRQTVAHHFPNLISTDTTLEQSASPATIEGADAFPPNLTPLDAVRAVPPISDGEELLERASVLLEKMDDPMELERVISALITFNGIDRSTIQRQFNPLVQRAHFFVKPGDFRLGQMQLALCILYWARADVPNGNTFGGERSPYEARLTDVARLIQRGKTLPLMSIPTHLSHWIDPHIFVQRFAMWSASSEEPVLSDLIVALFRLAFQNRETALREASTLPGETGAAIRYALGGDDKIAGQTRDLWVAASQARFRLKAHPDLCALFPDCGPVGEVFPKLSWELRATSYASKGENQRTLYNVKYTLSQSVSRPGGSFNIPAAYFDQIYALVPLGTLWPGGNELLYLRGVIESLPGTSRLFRSDHELTELAITLGDPLAEFGPYARHFLNLSLSSDESEVRRAAAHAFVSGMDRSLDVKLLGKSIHEFFKTGLMFPGRIRKSLDQVAGVSDRHRRALLDYLAEVFKGDPAQAPDQMVKLLELYYEIQTEFSCPLQDPETIAYLQCFPGGGRAVKLAKQIVGWAKV